MNMDMETPVDPAVANLPLSDPGCNSSDCTAFALAINISQTVTPFAGQFDYGHYATWYYLAILVLFIVFAKAQRYLDHRSSSRTSEQVEKPSLAQKCKALGRSVAYRRVKGRTWAFLELPPFGVLTLLLLTVVFFAILTFAARPYYRHHEAYGSPPIAIRTGALAFACTPILIALGGKANVITLLTGISHEKLNVLHRWIGYIILVLSLVHTIPFFYQPLHDPIDTLYFEFYGYGLGGGTMVSSTLESAVTQKLSCSMCLMARFSMTRILTRGE